MSSNTSFTVFFSESIVSRVVCEYTVAESCNTQKRLRKIVSFVISISFLKSRCRAQDKPIRKFFINSSRFSFNTCCIHSANMMQRLIKSKLLGDCAKSPNFVFNWFRCYSISNFLNLFILFLSAIIYTVLS